MLHYSFISVLGKVLTCILFLNKTAGVLWSESKDIQMLLFFFGFRTSWASPLTAYRAPRCSKEKELETIYCQQEKNKHTLTHAHEKSARIADTLRASIRIESDWLQEVLHLNVMGRSLHLTVLQVISPLQRLQTGSTWRHFCNFLCFPPSLDLKRTLKKRRGI